MNGVTGNTAQDSFLETWVQDLISDSACGYFVCNITKNYVLGDVVDLMGGCQLPSDYTSSSHDSYKYSDLIAFWCDRFVKEGKEQLLESISAENLLNCFAENRFMIERIYSAKLPSSETVKYKLSIFLSKERLNGDVIGLFVFEEMAFDSNVNSECQYDETDRRFAKEKAEFLFDMAHVVRFPIGNILSYVSKAKSNLDDKKSIEENLNQIEKSGEIVLKIINDILDLTRIECGSVSVESIPMNIKTFAKRFMMIVEKQAAEKKVCVDLNLLNLKNEDIFADAIRIDRVLLAIIGNSVQFSKEGGKVTLTVQQVESKRPGYAGYDFIVQDNGVGMSKEYLNHIFDPFSKESAFDEVEFSGSGLGMTITKYLVDLMGGTLNVESRQGEGTTVTCHFDFRVQMLPEVEPADEPKSIRKNKKIVGKRALVVDDNILNNEITKNLLESQGMLVEVAYDGEQAVSLMRDNKANYYDIIFMDMQMPNLDGCSACRTIRGFHGRYFIRIPIIAMLMNDFREEIKKAYAAGMNSYIQKPVAEEDLIKILQQFV